MNVVATNQQRQQVLRAIDKIEEDMLLEWQRVELDLAYNKLKLSGKLQSMEQERAFQEELRWSSL
jgi:hypothetical protein